MIILKNLLKAVMSGFLSVSGMTDRQTDRALHVYI